MKKLINVFIDEFKKVHRNIPQMLMFLIDAQIMVALFARGTGKTHGVTATWVYLRAKILPRSQGFILSQSYAHLIDTIIPQMQQGWGELGLEEGTHYWIRELPPAELELDKPYLPVDDPKYFIFWINGSVTKLVSLDRKSMVNSKSFDYGAICEGRKLDGVEIHDSVIPTLRGGRANLLPDGRRFGELHQHGSLLIETDLPHDIKGRWVLDFKKEVDQTTVDDIMKLQRYKYDKLQELQKAKSQKKKNEIEAILADIENNINMMRHELVFVGKASTLDNIHALGIKPLKKLKRTLTQTDWDISILNLEQEEVLNNFYRSLTRKVHGFIAGFNYEYIDNAPKKEKKNWRWNKGYDYSLPLIICMDTNNAHNCMGVHQIQGNKAKTLKYFYNLSEPGHPKDYKDLANEIVEYYRGFPSNEIIFVYNNTMVAGMKAGLKTKAQEVIDIFETTFNVEDQYLGQAMEHSILIDEWERFLNGEAEIQYMIELQETGPLYKCMKRTPTIIVENSKGRKFKKDKSSERKAGPQELTTHGTEMEDQFLQYIIQKHSSYKANKSRAVIAAG
ncbi:MAG: hypothetical protein ACOVOV_04580 [Dolichospermum sp.]